MSRLLLLLLTVTAAGTGKCRKEVELTLWHSESQDGNRCTTQTCLEALTQWKEVKELYRGTEGVRCTRIHRHSARAARFFDAHSALQSRILSSDAALTLRFGTPGRGKGGYSAIMLDRGAEAALALNTLCEWSTPKFPPPILRTIQILEGQRRLSRAELMQLAKEARLDGFDPVKPTLTPLLSAAAGHDSGTLNWLLRAGADPTRRDASGNSALHLCVKGGHLGSIDDATQLLEAGASLEDANDLRETPLHVLLQEWPDHFFSHRNSSANIFIRHLQRFLHIGARHEFQDNWNQSPLTIAAATQNLAAVRWSLWLT